MQNSMNFLTESRGHMEHLDDLILNDGVEGARQAINTIRGLRDMLAGHAKSHVDVTVKWDGAPAVFAGVDPTDGRFFVAKKGIFNKDPKVYKTPAEVDADTKGDLAEKLKIALAELPKLGIKGIVQGDFLFSQSDLKAVKFEGETYITFHPNTIVYAVPFKSELGKKIRKAKMGIVWHTTYHGNSFENLRASFGKAIASHLKDTPSVWSVDAMYRDTSGSATFTDAETKQITAILSQVGKLFNQIDKHTLNGIHEIPELLLRTKVFVNSKVRKGERIGNTAKFTDDLVKYLMDYFDGESDKRKTDRGKGAVDLRRKRVLGYFGRTDKKKIRMIFDMIDLLTDAKHMLIRKLDTAKSTNTLLLTKDGFRVTNPEGYVALDHLGRNAVKLVDRLQFSHANFSPDIVKGWQR